jgi:hypothetical protein
MRRSNGIASAIAPRVRNVAGIACVLATFALLSPGVRVVHADSAEPGSPSTLAAPAAASPASPVSAPDATPVATLASPVVSASDVEAARRPGVSGIEVAPGIVVLNTRGFNYGPPTAPLAPEAMKQEAAKP